MIWEAGKSRGLFLKNKDGSHTGFWIDEEDPATLFYGHRRKGTGTVAQLKAQAEVLYADRGTW